MTEPITFYDLNSTLEPKQWSPNTMKTRLVLNYFGIPYKVEFLPYVDIEPFLKGKPGISHWDVPNVKQAKVPYTLPAIKMSEERYIMGSEEILDALLEEYDIPRSRIVPNEDFYQTYVESIHDVLKSHINFVTIAFAENFIDDKSKEYYRESRKKTRGIDTAEMRSNKKEITLSWIKFLDELNSFRIFKEALSNSDTLSVDLLQTGDYLYDNKLSYADILLYAMIHWVLCGVEVGSLDCVDSGKIDKDHILSPWLQSWYDRMDSYNR